MGGASVSEDIAATSLFWGLGVEAWWVRWHEHFIAKFFV